MKVKAAALATCCFALIGMAAKPADATTVIFDWTLTGPAASLGGVPSPVVVRQPLRWRQAVIK